MPRFPKISEDALGSVRTEDPAIDPFIPATGFVTPVRVEGHKVSRSSWGLVKELILSQFVDDRLVTLFAREHVVEEQCADSLTSLTRRGLFPSVELMG